MLLAFAGSFGILLLAAAFIGLGSAVFHPESPRIALASRPAGSTNSRSRCSRWAATLGSAIGPLMAAAVIVPFGQKSVGWFGLASLLGAAMLVQVSRPVC